MNHGMTCVNWGIYHFVQALYNSVIKYAGSFNAMIYDLHIYKHFKLTKESYGGSMTGITIEGKKKMRKSIQSITDKIKQERQYNNKIYYASDMEYLASEILSAMPDTTDDRNSCITPVVSIAKAMGFDTFQQDLLWFLSGCIGINKKYIKKFKTDHIIFTNRKVHPYQHLLLPMNWRIICLIMTIRLKCTIIHIRKIVIVQKQKSVQMPLQPAYLCQRMPS